MNTLFETASNPLVVEYDAGHRFPRQLSDEGFVILKSFVRDQYIVKNGGDEEFDVEHCEFNF